MQADYNYYTATFHGSMSEADFNRLIRQAAAYVDSITFGRANDSIPNAVAGKVKDAQCAIADILLKQENGGVLASASNDGYSETYAVGKETQGQRMYGVASAYLATTGLLFCGGLTRC